MTGTPYDREKPTPEQVAEAKDALRADIAEFAAAIAEDRPAENDTDQIATLGRLCHRAATLASVIMFDEYDNALPPSIFLGQIAGIMIESELDEVQRIFSDHARDN